MASRPHTRDSRGASSKNPAVVLVNHEVNKGYGSAVKSGFNKASLDYTFFMDSDGQFDITDLGQAYSIHRRE
ncbi:MAG: glycosyltransferase [Thermodesulfobacteriota bacterium]